MSSANAPPPQIRWWYSSERKRLLSAVTVAAAIPGSVMLVAFAAGFTKRLVERAIETVAPASKP
jgi:hypothetical protein